MAAFLVRGLILKKRLFHSAIVIRQSVYKNGKFDKKKITFSGLMEGRSRKGRLYRTFPVHRKGVVKVIY